MTSEQSHIHLKIFDHNHGHGHGDDHYHNHNNNQNNNHDHHGHNDKEDIENCHVQNIFCTDDIFKAYQPRTERDDLIQIIKTLDKQTLPILFRLQFIQVVEERLTVNEQNKQNEQKVDMDHHNQEEHQKVIVAIQYQVLSKPQYNQLMLQQNKKKKLEDFDILNMQSASQQQKKRSSLQFGLGKSENESQQDWLKDILLPIFQRQGIKFYELNFETLGEIIQLYDDDKEQRFTNNLNIYDSLMDNPLLILSQNLITKNDYRLIKQDNQEFQTYLQIYEKNVVEEFNQRQQQKDQYIEKNDKLYFLVEQVCYNTNEIQDSELRETVRKKQRRNYKEIKNQFKQAFQKVSSKDTIQDFQQFQNHQNKQSSDDNNIHNPQVLHQIIQNFQAQDSIYQNNYLQYMLRYKWDGYVQNKYMIDGILFALIVVVYLIYILKIYGNTHILRTKIDNMNSNFQNYTYNGTDIVAYCISEKLLTLEQKNLFDLNETSNTTLSEACVTQVSSQFRSYKIATIIILIIIVVIDLHFINLELTLFKRLRLLASDKALKKLNQNSFAKEYLKFCNKEKIYTFISRYNTYMQKKWFEVGWFVEKKSIIQLLKLQYNSLINYFSIKFNYGRKKVLLNNKCKMIIQKKDNIFRDVKKVEKKISNILFCQFLKNEQAKDFKGHTGYSTVGQETNQLISNQQINKLQEDNLQNFFIKFINGLMEIITDLFIILFSILYLFVYTIQNILFIAQFLLTEILIILYVLFSFNIKNINLYFLSQIKYNVYWNVSQVIDVCSRFILLITFIIELATNEYNVRQVRICHALTILFLFTSLLFYAKVYEGSQFFIIMFIQVIKDMKNFLIFMVSLGFALILSGYVIQQNLVGDGANITFATTIYAYYSLIIYGDSGKFGTLTTYEENYSTFQYYISSLFMSVIMLNFLISIISDTYGRVKENKLGQMYHYKCMAILFKDLQLAKNQKAVLKFLGQFNNYLIKVKKIKSTQLKQLIISNDNQKTPLNILKEQKQQHKESLQTIAEGGEDQFEDEEVKNNVKNTVFRNLNNDPRQQ